MVGKEIRYSRSKYSTESIWHHTIGYFRKNVQNELDTMIEIFTDGSARGNPGPGGYGIVMRYKQHYKEISQGYRHTSNNRMELLAVIVALETLKKASSTVTVYSDSKYVIEAINQKWVFGWEKKLSLIHI